jgi:tetratricopeptide (TPR) repeat protein
MAALRIAAALGFFWYTHGHSAEGSTHLERTLAAAVGAPPLLRGRALHALGILRSQRGDERAEATFQEGLAMFRAADDQARIAVALNSLGVIARNRRDAAAARASFEEAIGAYRSLGDRHRLADSLSNLAFVAIDEEQFDEAAALFRESITLDRGHDNQWGVAQNLTGQAVLALARGEPDEAFSLLAQAVEALRPLGDRLSVVMALEWLAATASHRKDHALAARLWGAATAQRDAAGEPHTPAEAAAIDPYVDASRAALGHERFAAAARAGAALDLEAALSEALTR